MEKKELQLAEIKEYIKKLDALLPIMEFEQPVKEDSYGVNEALARAYSDVAFRKHIKNRINKQIYHSAVHSTTIEEVWMNAGRITILKELYRDMEKGYTQFLPKGQKPLL